MSSKIHKMQQLEIQSSGRRLVKLSYMSVSADQIKIYFHMTCSTYRTLLLIFTNRAVKLKKL